MKTTCDICGAQLMMIRGGAAICPAGLDGNGEMHGKVITPGAEQAKEIKRAWKHRNLPKARACKAISAKGTGEFFTPRIFIVADRLGLWRRVGRAKPEEGQIRAAWNDSEIQLVRWPKLEAEIISAGFVLDKPQAMALGPGVATPETSELKDDPFGSVPITA